MYCIPKKPKSAKIVMSFASSGFLSFSTLKSWTAPLAYQISLISPVSTQATMKTFTVCLFFYPNNIPFALPRGVQFLAHKHLRLSNCFLYSSSSSPHQGNPGNEEESFRQIYNAYKHRTR